MGLGIIAQGHKATNTSGTNTFIFLYFDEIKIISTDKWIAYVNIVVDCRLQKLYPNRVKIKVGGNLIKYPHEVTLQPADLVVIKILWNSVVRTPNGKCVCADVKNFCLTTRMEHFEYICIPIKLIPQSYIDEYDLQFRNKDGLVYMEFRKGVYWLTQAGILANQLLKKKLAKYSYYDVPHKSMETPLMTKPIHIGCQRLWHQILEQKGCRAFIKRPKRPLQRGNQLDWWTLLWNHTWLNLQKQIHWYLHARIHQKATPNIYEHILKIAHTQLQPRSVAKPPKIPSQKALPRNYQKLRKWSLTGCWQHTLLCPCCWHHNPNDTKHIVAEPQNSLWILLNDSQLLYNVPKCKNQIQKIRYDT